MTFGGDDDYAEDTPDTPVSEAEEAAAAILLEAAEEESSHEGDEA